MTAVPDQVARWVGRPYTSLGTDGFGRSDTREALRRFFEPILIRRHVVRRVELDAHEDLRRDRDTFLRQIGRDRMDAHELRRQPIGPAEASLGL